MVRSLALLAAVVGAATAADSTATVSILLPMADPQPLVGSVVNADSAATTFVIGCAPGTPAESCGIPGSQTVLQGPSTWSISMAYTASGDGVYTQDVKCKLDAAKDVATCTATESRDDGNSKFQSKTADTIAGYKTLMLPVTITAGADKLSAAPGATGATGTTGTGTDKGTASAASTASSASSASNSAASNSAASTSTKSGNAAAPLVTQNAVLAGVAAVIGGAMLL